VIRSTLAHVNLEALAHNLAAIRARLARSRSPGGTPELIAVVKANAYGHGAQAVALALEEAGARMLACADIEEAIVLRDSGVKARILVFGALSLSRLDGLFTHDLVPTISTPWAARAVERAAERHGVRLPYHLKIDTGMNRLGFRHDNIERTLPAVLESPNLVLEGMYTHFATADAPGDSWFAEQRARFAVVLKKIRAMGARPRMIHAANSAALLADESTWFDAVRPGLLLYGIVPEALANRMTLEPVMSLTSQVVAVKGVRPGEIVGYGARFQASRPTTIAVVPAGYADGLDVRLAGRGSVLIRGRRAPIVGSVCMDMITVDVTGMEVSPGDEVVIMGRQGGQCVSVAEMARTIGTIPYEIVCRIGSRIQRIYNRVAE
jgi:alanine racemase